MKPSPRRLVTCAVVIVAAGLGSGFALGAMTSSRTGASSGATTTQAPALSARDRTIVSAVPGNCISYYNRLDATSSTQAPIAIISCSDPRATFSVAAKGSRLGTKAGCNGIKPDTTIISPTVKPTLCLNRVISPQQCILSNGTNLFFDSAVPCDGEPVPPFTQILRIDAVAAPGSSLPCAPGTINLTTPTHILCYDVARSR